MSTQLNEALAQSDRPYWIWGPLAFSSFYFLPLLFNFSAFAGLKLIAVFLIYACFVFLYYKAVNSIGEKAFMPVLAMILLSIGGTYITPGTQSLFGFAAYFCGFNFAFNKGIQGLIGILLAIVFSAFTFNFVDAFFLAPAIVVSIGLFSFGHAERKERLHEQTHKKSQDTIEQLATIAERERIARDLHDLVGHSLSSIALKAELAEKLMLAGQQDKAQQEVAAVASLSREVLSEVRTAVSNLKQQQLSEKLSNLANQLKSHGFSVHVSNNTKQLDANVETNVVLMLTEACTNILRHSKGNEVSISLSQSPDRLTITINDNGESEAPTMGNGLQGISERCEQLGGLCEIHHDNGFGLAINIPTRTV
ncbi:histidine kinase [Thalassotalea euphylliae]|uniref:histidine kinase n=1 Tax=Thalassotalea euphylliae TaxID=1655234 RepID=UPI003641ACDC